VRKEKFPHKFIGFYVNQHDTHGKNLDVDNITLPLFMVGFAKILQSNLELSEATLSDHAELLEQVSLVRDKKLLFVADLMYMAELSGPDGWDKVKKYANCHLREIESSVDDTWKSYKSNKDMLFMIEWINPKARASCLPLPQSRKFAGKRKAANEEMKSYVCKHWNNSTCSLSSDHVTNDILWHHQCDACSRKGSLAQHKSMGSF
jgi:hypothetical protein